MLKKHILWTFWMFVVTITSDVKIYLIVCESYCVKLKFLWTSSIVKVFDFLTFSHVADAPSPCQMPPLLSKAPHPATYPHYAIPTIGLDPSTWPHPCHIPPPPATCSHISTSVCVWPQCLWLNVCMWLKYVYVWWVGEGWVGEYQSYLLSSTIPYPKISKVICHQVPCTQKRYQSNFLSSTIPLKNISICFKVPYPRPKNSK